MPWRTLTAAIALAGGTVTTVEVGWNAALAQGEHGDCVAQLPECLEVLVAQGQPEESTAYAILQSWLVSLYAGDATARTGLGSLATDADTRQAALAHLQRLAGIARTARPSLALAVGQMLLSFFWWGGGEYLDRKGVKPSGPDPAVAALALDLLEQAVHHQGCDLPSTPRSKFLEKSCPWRLRFVLLLGSELGRYLMVGSRDMLKASSTFQRTKQHWLSVQRLPFFQEAILRFEGGGGEDILDRPPWGFLGWNQNRDFFPQSAHWPIWPQEVWPSYAHFLQENYATFRQGLDALLEADPQGTLFHAIAMQQQSELAPNREDWVRLDLVHGGGFSDLCNMIPALKASCEILAARPEIDSRCTTYLAGAALARLLPGAEIKPHFDSHGRLAAHLGLRSVEGASMMVGGEVVTWEEGRAVVFDDTYAHSVRHDGHEPRYVLVSWFCHPCDLAWRERLGDTWLQENPLPKWCGGGGGEPPVPGYGDRL